VVGWMLWVCPTVVSAQPAGLLPVERVWLDLLMRPVRSTTTCYFPRVYRFGLHDVDFSNAVVLKSAAGCWFLLDGTDRVYRLERGSDGPYLKRVDSSSHSGSNFHMIAFLRHDTLYRVGGYGFWRTRRGITWFDGSTGTWKLWSGAPSLPTTHTVYRYDAASDALLLAGVWLTRPHEHFRVEFWDSLYRLDFRRNRWENLGMLDRRDLSFTAVINTPVLHLAVGPYGTVKVKGGATFLLDLPRNAIMPLREGEGMGLVGLEEPSGGTDMGFNRCFLMLDDSLFTVVVSDSAVSVKAVHLPVAMFDTAAARPLVARGGVGGGRPGGDGRVWVAVWGLVLVVFAGYLWRRPLQEAFMRHLVRRRPTAAVSTDASDALDLSGTSSAEVLRHFAASLRHPQRLLLENIVQAWLTGRPAGTEDLNRWLGLTRKPASLQKVVRSKALHAINADFRMAVKADVDLIERVRDPQDKRVLIYRVQDRYAEAIAAALQPPEPGVG